MTFHLFVVIGNWVYFLSGLGLLITLIRIRRRRQEIKILGIYFVASLLSLFLTKLLYSLGISPNYAATAYLLAVFPVISFIYYLAFDKRYGNVLMTVALCFEAFGIINVLLVQRGAINSYTYIVISLIMIVYGLSYFFTLMKEMPTYDLYRLPMFWINSAFMIYFAGNLFLFVFTDYLVDVLNNNLIVYWTIHNVLSIIEVLIFIVAAIVDLMNSYKSEGIRRSAF
jgi:hypothetical protein